MMAENPLEHEGAREAGEAYETPYKVTYECPSCGHLNVMAVTSDEASAL